MTPPSSEQEPPALVTELTALGVTAKTAGELVRDFGEEKVQLQLDILDGMPAKKRAKIDDLAAWLVTAIRNGHAAPKNFKTKAQREQAAEAKRQQQEAEASDRRLQQQEADQARQERQAIAGYWSSLTPEQQAAHDAAAIAQAGGEELKLIEPGPMQKIGLGIVRDNYTRKLLQADGRLPQA